MGKLNRIVISASRRTDIPSFYMEWFMNRIEAGSFEIVNPYNGRVSRVIASPENIHTIVFWSKDFGPFIDGGYGERLIEKGYNLFFNFTVNSDSRILEPQIPSLEKRIDQLQYLSRNFNPETINWRFDPICFYNRGGKKSENNFGNFSFIAGRVSDCGIKRCISSFMDHYPKIKKRVAGIPGFSFFDPEHDEKIRILLEMEETLSAKDISLQICCEKNLIEKLPVDSSIRNASCVPNELLAEIYSNDISLGKDYGQRVKKGCGCKTSVDIGSYNLHPCYNNCLFCYANPVKRTDR